VRVAVVARVDERQLHHPAVERHGAVVVAGVPQATEGLDHAGRVVGHQATQVPDSWGSERDWMAAISAACVSSPSRRGDRILAHRT